MNDTLAHFLTLLATVPPGTSGLRLIYKWFALILKPVYRNKLLFRRVTEISLNFVKLIYMHFTKLRTFVTLDSNFTTGIRYRKLDTDRREQRKINFCLLHALDNIKAA